MTISASTHKENLIKCEEQFTSIEKLYQNNIIATKENENLYLNGQTKLMTIEGDTVLTKDIFKDDKLIFIYSLLNCRNCIDAEFENLGKFAKGFYKNVVVITYQERLRDLIMDYTELQKLGLDNIEMYLLIDNQLNIPIEKHNIPYYFHINPDLKMNNFFIPLKEQPKLSEYYLKYSHKNYFYKK
ncbi:hypothetical protein [Aestuariibaculum sp. M13]|uniref:hypothetical protein n=1 Tax=Aestuariibaculum sp. M13 TaxID=2967132 RepID=UPI002159ED9B|nr:hypothetical protein [Aestuariibaculum sp. M13]